MEPSLLTQTPTPMLSLYWRRWCSHILFEIKDQSIISPSLKRTQRLGKDKTTSLVYCRVFRQTPITSAFSDPTLIDIDCMIRSAPLEFAFTPKKWCSLDDLEILKKANRINIEEMRLIQLMHPDYQINNRNIGRKVLANAKICNEVAEEQHGSRKHH